MKIFLRIILFLFILLTLSGIGGYFYIKQKMKVEPSHLTIQAENATTPFTWWMLRKEPESHNYGAMIVPIQLSGCPDTFLLQFDTGAPRCRFRYRSIQSINEKYNNLTIQEIDGEEQLVDLSFKVGDIPIHAKQVELYVRKGGKPINWEDTLYYPLIGTIGADFMDKGITIIDYPNRKIHWHQNLPDSLEQSVAFSPLSFKNRRVFIEGTLNGDNTGWFMWDSGTSRYEFMTSKNHWEQLAKPGAVPDMIPVNSWGDTLYTYNIASESVLVFGGNKFPVNTVTYVDKMAFMQSFLVQLTGLNGLTGNKLFINDVIVLDVKEGRFGRL